MLALPYGLAALTLVIAAALGHIYALRLARRGIQLDQRIRARDLPLIPATLLLFVALLATAHLATRYPNSMWRMPLMLDYYYRPIFWVLKLAFVTFPLSAIAFLAFRVRNRSRYIILAVVIIVVAAVEVQMRVIHRPYLGEVKDERTADGVIKQSNASTCAAAACANIARHFGRDVTEVDMIHVLNTSWEGTSPAQIVYGLRSLGFDARKVESPSRDLAEIRPPAVLLVDVGMEVDAHAIAYIRRDGDNFEMLDPASKRSVTAADQIRERWRGHAIEVRMPAVDGRKSSALDAG